MVDKRNATASWSGYLHQGQAGILVALREINKLLAKSEPLNDWCIIFENAEDFDIQNSVGVYSRHQVKAYKGAQYPNSVKDVLGTQVYRDGKLESKGFQFRRLDNGVLTDIEVDEDSRYLHVIDEIKGYGLSEDDFNEKYPNATWVSNIHNIKLYEYSTGVFHCPLVTLDNSTLESYCLYEIQCYLQKIKHCEAAEIEYQRKIYHSLIHRLDIEIKKRHIDKGSTYPTLLFNDIDTILKNNPDQRAYLISSCKKILATIVNDYITDLFEGSNGLEQSVIDRLEYHSSEIYHLENEAFIQFLRDINPNETNVGTFTSISDAISLVKKDNFRKVFLQCLYRVSGSEYNLSERGYQNDGGYILSLIIDDSVSIKSVKRRISENSMLTKALFDKSYLINNEISDPEDITKNDPSQSLNWGNNTSNSDRFDKSHMRLISVPDAINKLN